MMPNHGKLKVTRDGKTKIYKDVDEFLKAQEELTGKELYVGKKKMKGDKVRRDYKNKLQRRVFERK